jgi:hypothetical protein
MNLSQQYFWSGSVEDAMRREARRGVGDVYTRQGERERESKKSVGTCDDVCELLDRRGSIFITSWYRLLPILANFILTHRNQIKSKAKCNLISYICSKWYAPNIASNHYKSHALNAR